MAILQGHRNCIQVAVCMASIFREHDSEWNFRMEKQMIDELLTEVFAILGTFTMVTLMTFLVCYGFNIQFSWQLAIGVFGARCLLKDIFNADPKVVAKEDNGRSNQEV